MVSANMLKRFLSNCPLLEDVYLNGEQKHVDFVTEGNMFTLVDLFRCVPMIFSLGISGDYIKHLSAGSIPHKLPTSLARLSYIYLEACLMEHNEISSAFCMFRSSPLLVGINFLMCDNAKSPVQKTPTNFLDLEDHSDLKLDNLELQFDNASKLSWALNTANRPVIKSNSIESAVLPKGDVRSKASDEMTIYP
ncbi:hypothetical protein QVD17_20876 [Tagetes erecta]|uniref:Uncharacterized protein n=1 Tax=Tagetes erecta TaxID=13708 RepID=A0AAD8NXM0_TARER|nr:hypothetical protein QVD17_20876 [Tagetes erecta]